jgi:hypothetical protein
MRYVMRIKGDQVRGYYQIIREMQQASEACEGLLRTLTPEEYRDMIQVGGPQN